MGASARNVFHVLRLLTCGRLANLLTGSKAGRRQDSTSIATTQDGRRRALRVVAKGEAPRGEMARRSGTAGYGGRAPTGLRAQSKGRRHYLQVRSGGKGNTGRGKRQVRGAGRAAGALASRKGRGGS